ncbi:MAG TPA: hypothetical protein VFK84_03390 [Burkholderiales bacterium]|nr:hypothetical protein [Burkholderiales bacterium]
MTAEPFISLSTAAAKTYRALVGGEASDGLLDVVAVALSACVPIYGARGEHEPLARLSDEDLARGTFIQGATRLHSFTRLAVTAADLAAAVERLRRAGVNFAHARVEPAPRRIPRVVPA